MGIKTHNYIVINESSRSENSQPAFADRPWGYCTAATTEGPVADKWNKSTISAGYVVMTQS
jgi:hypothetical protein